jgi:hypothetical protein
VRFEGFIAGSEAPDMWIRPAEVYLALDGKVATVSAPGCVVEGQGAFEMSSFGSWAFHAGSITASSCESDESRNDVAKVIGLLERATEWSRDGSYFTFTAADSPSWADDEMEAYFVELTDEDLTGQWRPVSLEGAPWLTGSRSAGGAEVAGPPYPWALTVDASRITLPSACNGETGAGYTAGKDGWFSFAEPDHASRFGYHAYDCEDLPMQQAGAVSEVLRSTTTWALRDGRLVFTRPGELTANGTPTELVLERVG